MSQLASVAYLVLVTATNARSAAAQALRGGKNESAADTFEFAATCKPGECADSFAAAGGCAPTIQITKALLALPSACLVGCVDEMFQSCVDDESTLSGLVMTSSCSNCTAAFKEAGACTPTMEVVRAMVAIPVECRDDGCRWDDQLSAKCVPQDAPMIGLSPVLSDSTKASLADVANDLIDASSLDVVASSSVSCSHCAASFTKARGCVVGRQGEQIWQTSSCTDDCGVDLLAVCKVNASEYLNAAAPSCSSCTASFSKSGGCKLLNELVQILQAMPSACRECGNEIGEACKDDAVNVAALPKGPPAVTTLTKVVLDMASLSSSKEALRLTNKERRKVGAPPLCENWRLRRAAQRHSNDQAWSGRMSHRGSDQSSVGQRVSRQGYAYSAVGENVARGYSSVSSAMRAWMRSSGHRRNILNARFTNMGFGVRSEFYTQVFGTPRRGSGCEPTTIVDPIR